MAIAVAVPQAGPGATPGVPRGDSIAFECIFVVAFAMFLAIALFAQLLTLDWRLWLPGAEGGKSLFHDVRSGVYTFMSFLS